MSQLEMTHEQYLKNPAYGSSDIIKMGRSFAFYKRKKESPDAPGRPLVIGSATHLMLEARIHNRPSLITDGLRVYEEGSSKTDRFKDFQKKNPKYYCIDMEEFQLCARMIQALTQDKEVMGYLDGAISEPTFIAKYPHTEVMMKCRPDYLHKERAVSINVKTAADASESGFLYSARDFQYDWQSVVYCDLLKQEFGRPFDEVHIVVEKGETDEECEVNIFTFNEDTLGFARSQIWEILQKIPECERTGKWPKNPAYLKEIGIPPYMRKVVQV